MTVTAAFFYLFATITVASGFMVIASRNPVQSVLFLILAFVNAAGLFVLLGAEFTRAYSQRVEQTASPPEEGAKRQRVKRKQ